jgi:hypothetical protein
MGLLERLLPGLFSRQQPIASAAALADFMDSRSAFLCQKCVVEFCRVRAGANWEKLFREKEFQDALYEARWKSYPPSFAMIAEMIEGVLRPPAGLEQRHLPEALEKLARAVFARYPVPERAPDSFWEDALDLVRERLAATQSGAPRPVREVPEPTARMVFNALPLHKNVITYDYDYIFNNLRMNLLRIHDDFLDAARLDELARDLVGRPSAS